MGLWVTEGRARKETTDAGSTWPDSPSKPRYLRLLLHGASEHEGTAGRAMSELCAMGTAIERLDGVRREISDCAAESAGVRGELLRGV